MNVDRYVKMWDRGRYIFIFHLPQNDSESTKTVCYLGFSNLIGLSFSNSIPQNIIHIECALLTAFSFESSIICWSKRKSTYLIIKNSFISSKDQKATVAQRNPGKVSERET